MLEQTADLYRSFLDGIKKSFTGTINPTVWNRLINEWGQSEWLKLNCSENEGIELGHKQLDDLEKIRIVTDGQFYYNGVQMLPIAPNVSGGKIFTYPKYVLVGIHNYNPPAAWGATQSYPKFHRLLNIAFKILYGSDNECDLTGVSGWLEAAIMRSDQRIPFSKSPYRKPKDSRLYYERIDGNIRLITGTTATGVAMRLEYLRKPVRIYFDEAYEIAHPGAGDNANPNYLPNTGSVNCELDDDQKKEIVDTCVRVFLERAQDPRYQSFLNEEAIRSNTRKS